MIDLDLENNLKYGDTTDHYEIRKRMIQQQVGARGVKDLLVLKAMKKVPRHRFVDEQLEYVAYDDTPLPIGDEQTISQPFIVAYMTAALELQGGEKILEVGTGSGYQAAILAEIVEHVYTIEINENLAIEVSRRLKKMGYENITLKFGDGYKGWPEQAPFDGIIVTAAPDHIPQTLLAQLNTGGKMVIPVGVVDQDLMVVSKLPDGAIKKESRIPVRFVPMIGESEKREKR
ncbi:MAG: protein-L-isoaspartate(D-aspartate) O-methyltransferase [bacterium]